MRKCFEMLATHNIQDDIELFSLVDKCTQTAKGRVCHAPYEVQ